MSEVERLAERADARGALRDRHGVPARGPLPAAPVPRAGLVGDEITLLDPSEGFDPAPIAGLLADPAVEVVLHAGRQDVAILRREWRTVTDVFDTQVAAGFAGFSAQAGYLGLLHDALRIRLAKSASFTRWDARPLTQEQLGYAREDVEHLLPLADELQGRLRERPAGVGARGVPGAAGSDERDPRRCGAACRARAR